MENIAETEAKARRQQSPWSWVPSLYFAEGIPYVIVMTIAAIMYKRLGLNNEEITLYTSWLYLPWVIKPFWSPVVDLLKSKRWWIVVMQLILGASMAGVAFTIKVPHFVQWTLVFFWLMAFSSATHDIAADGFYMLALEEHEQSMFVGVRSTFYRVATIAGQGLLVMFAGTMEVFYRNPFSAWMATFFVCTGTFLLLFCYHAFMLPRPRQDSSRHLELKEFAATFKSFFLKPQFLVAVIFMLLYRFPEALLIKICPLFMLDPVSKGGLGMTTAEVGFVQGTVGVIGLLLGGILGGVLVASKGLKKMLLPMVLSITLPHVVYIFLAYYQTESLALINISVFLEQFGYGFGFTAYMLYMMYFSQGKNTTAHYAFCTGFMALSMMLPGLFAGALQQAVGYLNFFIIVLCLTPLTFIAAGLIKVDEHYGKGK
ncbi:MFS transporter [uncultured Alloprevotella sp.]|uniref:MFS transporter n=1 Tax=uncultured Alloprevotella sp. TaxID=1283315 RepID=UPI0026399F41|nr:MFS transporter [uncultured Alloprevotella sp.]